VRRISEVTERAKDIDRAGKHTVHTDKALTRSVLFFFGLLVLSCRSSQGTTYRF
jgi:hypothetical protein